MISRFTAKISVFVLKTISIAFVLCAGAATYADDQTDTSWSLDVDLAHQQQDLAKSTAKSTSLVIAPDLVVGNWDLSLSLPWYDMQGEFYINGVRPRLITRCERITALTPAKQQILLDRGKITQKQLTRCDKILETLANLNESHNGIGDATAFAHYRLPLGDESNWGASFGLGYKADTGDSEVGIGSGTKDGLLEAGISYRPEGFSFSANIGYDFVSGDDSVADVYPTRNFVYANLNLSKELAKWLSVGVSFNDQQSYLTNESDTKILSEYIDLTPWDQVNIHFFISQYSGSSTVPDKEVGANISYSF